MANAYYTHIPVDSAQEASIFSDEYTWTIFDVLREAGAKGLTEIELSEAIEKEQGVGVSRSKIYALLRRLYEEKLAHRYYDPEAQARRYTLAPIWGGIMLNDNFYSETKEKMIGYIKKRLFPIFEEYLKKVMEDFSDNVTTKKWLPQAGKKNFCKKCRASHEAEEFFDSILDVAILEFVESENFEKLLQVYDFAEQ